MTHSRALFITTTGACLIYRVTYGGPDPHPKILLTQGQRLVQEHFLGRYRLVGKSRSSALVYLMEDPDPLTPTPTRCHT
jgi:hypothetical protein